MARPYDFERVKQLIQFCVKAAGPMPEGVGTAWKHGKTLAH